MADDRERDEGADETKVSAQVPPEEVGDEAAAGTGPGDTDESPAVRRDESSGEIVFAREAAEAADDLPPPPPPPELEPAPATPAPYERTGPRPLAAEQAASEPAETDEPAAPDEAEAQSEPEPPPPPAPTSGGPPPPPPESTGPASPAEADRRAAEESASAFAARPELYAAGAFVGGFVIARALKFFFGEDDE